MKLSSAMFVLLALMLAGTSASPMVGGKHAAPVGEEAQEAARFAVQQLVSKPEFQSPSNGLLQIEEIVDVKTQVVAGLNYYITMKVRTPEGVKTVETVVWRKLGGSANAPNMELTNYMVHTNRAT